VARSNDDDTYSVTDTARVIGGDGKSLKASACMDASLHHKNPVWRVSGTIGDKKVEPFLLMRKPTGEPPKSVASRRLRDLFATTLRTTPGRLQFVNDLSRWKKD